MMAFCGKGMEEGRRMPTIRMEEGRRMPTITMRQALLFYWLSTL